MTTTRTDSRHTIATPATVASRLADGSHYVNSRNTVSQRSTYVTKTAIATRRMCLDKIRYATESHAAAAIGHQRWLIGQDLSAYSCANCAGLHLTSSKRRRPNTVDIDVPIITESRSVLLKRGHTKHKAKTRRPVKHRVHVATDAEITEFFRRHAQKAQA